MYQVFSQNFAVTTSTRLERWEFRINDECYFLFLERKLLNALDKVDYQIGLLYKGCIGGTSLNSHMKNFTTVSKMSSPTDKAPQTGPYPRHELEQAIQAAPQNIPIKTGWRNSFSIGG